MATMLYWCDFARQFDSYQWLELHWYEFAQIMINKAPTSQRKSSVRQVVRQVVLDNKTCVRQVVLDNIYIYIYIYTYIGHTMRLHTCIIHIYICIQLCVYIYIYIVCLSTF